MLNTIESSKEISTVYKKFKSILLASCSYNPVVTVGFPGGSVKTRVHYSTKYNFWFTTHRFSADKYWNAFGLGRPSTTHANTIIVEINFPISGIKSTYWWFIVTRR